MINFRRYIKPHVQSECMSQLKNGLYRCVLKTSCGIVTTGEAVDEWEARSRAAVSMRRQDKCDNTALGGAQ